MHGAAPELDRAAGALVGLAAGDALGAGYRSGPPPEGEPDLIGGGAGGREPGEWTDETQLAICVAKEAAAGRIRAQAVAGRFLAWYRSRPADVGTQTSAVLSAARSAREVAPRAAAYHAEHPHESPGNGCLACTGPVALAHLGDDAAMAATARQLSSLTHADRRAGDACVLWSIAIDRAIRQARLDGVRDGLALLPVDRRRYWADRLDEAERRPFRSFTSNQFAVTALQAAYAAVVQTPVPEGQPSRHLRDALVAAVRIGNETDAVAAIAGALLGARWGASAVPESWQAQLHGWPGYHCDDLLRLAVLVARSGARDRRP